MGRMNNIHVELDEYNNKYSMFSAGLDEYLAVSTITKQWRNYLATHGYRHRCRVGVVGRKGEPRQCRNKIPLPNIRDHIWLPNNYYCARHSGKSKMEYDPVKNCCTFVYPKLENTTLPFFNDERWKESVLERKRRFKQMQKTQKLTGCLIDDD